MQTMRKKGLPTAAILSTSTLVVACNLLLDNQTGTLDENADASTSSGQITSSSGQVADGASSSSGTTASSSGAASSSGTASSSSSGSSIAGCTLVGPDDLCVLDGIEGVSQIAATEHGLYLLRTGTTGSLTYLSEMQSESTLLAAASKVVSSWDVDRATEHAYAEIDDGIVRCAPAQCSPITLDDGESIIQLKGAQQGKALLFTQRNTDVGSTAIYLRVVPDSNVVTRMDPIPLSANANGPVLVAGEIIYVPSYDLAQLGSQLVTMQGLTPGTWSAVAADDQHAYLTGRCPQATICQIPLVPQGSVIPSRVYTRGTAAGVSSLFVDGGVLFWTAVETNETWRCTIADCDQTAAMIAPRATSFSRSSTHVFFAADGKVYKLGRN